MTWIFLMMLAMIVGSVVVELMLPASVKQKLGFVICWSMRAVTMLGLGAATLGLIYVAGTNIVLPLISGGS